MGAFGRGGLFADNFLDDDDDASNPWRDNSMQFGAHLLPEETTEAEPMDYQTYGSPRMQYANREGYQLDEISEFESPGKVSSRARGEVDQYVAHQPYDDDYALEQVAPMTPLVRPGIQPSAPLRMLGVGGGLGLRAVSELPAEFRSVFSRFPYFNKVQSDCLDELLYSNAPIVVSAPTGSGKTVLFELAILRLIMRARDSPGLLAKTKAVYMAPIKALCSERFDDWKAKFEPLGLSCKELTGDSDVEDYYELRGANLILTTPEKWDSMTRKWRDNQSLVQEVRLFMVDEIHTLNDVTRGATIEAVVSRMKTVQSHADACRKQQEELPADDAFESSVRFVAVSATIPNIDDLAEWLGRPGQPAVYRKMDPSLRPVPLTVEVLGYPDANNAFKFDMNLNYKLFDIVKTRGNNKPALIFCSTRKSVQQAAAQLQKSAVEARRMEDRFVKTPEMRQRLQKISVSIKEKALKEFVLSGIGYHHAGLDMSDRKLIEKTFIEGDLPVLCATSTLAMGVNLPAHLVVIKSTEHYEGGMVCEYTESQVLQMMGRAGRPQFDTSATAVIMTKFSCKRKYESLASGSEVIESRRSTILTPPQLFHPFAIRSLHLNLIEHINAEVVLNTITDVSVALDWIKSTFLFVRIRKNPVRYDLPRDFTREQMEHRLQTLCLDSLKELAQYELAVMDDDMGLMPTDTGKLLARYCVAFATMKGFITSLPPRPTLQQLLDIFSNANEFKDMRLRLTEKRVLNDINTSKDKPIRYPIKGKIKTTEQKISCLIQATLGGVAIADFSLSQDRERIFRAGTRIAKCLAEYVSTKNDFEAVIQASTLSRCMRVRLWENSTLVAKQIEKIGEKLASLLANAGLASFEKLEETSSTTIELVVGRNPPFGAQVREAVSRIPRFCIELEQLGDPTMNSAELELRISIANHDRIFEEGIGRPSHGSLIVAVGDKTSGDLVFHKRIMESMFAQSPVWTRKISVARSEDADETEVTVRLIHEGLVGVDRDIRFQPSYLPDPEMRKRAALKKRAARQKAEERRVPDMDNYESGTDADDVGMALLEGVASIEEYGSLTRGAVYFQQDGEAGNFDVTWELRDDDDAIDGPRKCGHPCANKARCGHACCLSEHTCKTSKKRKAAREKDDLESNKGKKTRVSKPRAKPETAKKAVTSPQHTSVSSEGARALELQRAKQVAVTQQQPLATTARMKLDKKPQTVASAPPSSRAVDLRVDATRTDIVPQTCTDTARAHKPSATGGPSVATRATAISSRGATAQPHSHPSAQTPAARGTQWPPQSGYEAAGHAPFAYQGNHLHGGPYGMSGYHASGHIVHGGGHDAVGDFSRMAASFAYQGGGAAAVRRVPPTHGGGRGAHNAPRDAQFGASPQSMYSGYNGYDHIHGSAYVSAPTARNCDDLFAGIFD